MPITERQWRVQRTLDEIDEQRRDGDDYPAATVTTIRRDSTQSMSTASCSGARAPSTRAINDVWASDIARRAQWENAYQPRSAMLAMRSGVESDTGWVTERRHLREDFLANHGSKPGLLSALAIMTDCDDIGQPSEAWYGEIRLLPAALPAEPMDPEETP